LIILSTVLFGITGVLVVNNAILLIDFYKAVELRIRPILLTTLLGVLPIALALGESGEILQPLGIAVFFGLLVSTDCRPLIYQVDRLRNLIFFP
jgi:multidrug efflux pump subunit AcrB